jgi:hypothetical protein
MELDDIHHVCETAADVQRIVRTTQHLNPGFPKVISQQSVEALHTVTSD